MSEYGVEFRNQRGRGVNHGTAQLGTGQRGSIAQRVLNAKIA